MVFFFTAALIIALLLEGTVVTLPLILVVLLSFTIMTRNTSVFLLGFLAGIFLDIMTVRTIGMSSIFFTIFLFVVLLYQRKYEINSYPFVFFASFLGAAGYLLTFGRGNVLIDSLITSFVALSLFATLRLVATKYVTTQKEYSI